MYLLDHNNTDLLKYVYYHWDMLRERSPLCYSPSIVLICMWKAWM